MRGSWSPLSEGDTKKTLLCGYSPMQPGTTGAWNLRNVRFYRPATLTSFGVASFEEERVVGQFHDPGSLMVCCRPQPLKISLGPNAPCRADRNRFHEHSMSLA